MKKKFLLFEDDPVSRLVWQSAIQTMIPESEVSAFSSVDEMSKELGSFAKIAENFDVIITDIFLSGDKTGIEFVAAMPISLQRRSIICSTIGADKFSRMRRQHDLQCAFVQKPLDNTMVRWALNYALGIRLPNDGTLKSVATHEDPRPVILVTGCNGGIGEPLARKLAAIENYRVALAVRKTSISYLRQIFEESSRLVILPIDLTDDQQMRSAVNEVVRRWGRIDVLINNAGTCYRAVTEHMDIDSELMQMRTNYLGPMMLSRLVVPMMRERGRGKIINVSSVSGLIGMPTMASYSASKHALEGASESLWYELKPLGINVSVIRPGFVNSLSFNRVIVPKKAWLAEELNGPYTDFYQFMRPFVARLMRVSPTSSETVADCIIKTVQTQNPRLWINATPDAHLFSMLRWLLPGNYFHRILNFLFKCSTSWGRGYTRASPRRMSA